MQATRLRRRTSDGPFSGPILGAPLIQAIGFLDSEPFLHQLNWRRPENFSFDQLIGELKSNQIKVPKSGTIKALNKERVIVKHYGQLAEPETVKNYLSAADMCIHAVLKQVFEKQIDEIWLHEFIRNEETKSCFEKALDYLTEGKSFRALVEIRKALFIEVESDYSIVGWKDFSSKAQGSESILDYFTRGGHKAPYWTRNKEWIEENVKEPFDYIQLDHQELRSDLLEWGVNTQDFWNLWRLTPSVFREHEHGKWSVKTEPEHFFEGATEENVKYCLDKAIGLIVKKRNHFDLRKSLSGLSKYRSRVQTKADPTRVFEKASSDSEVTDELKPGIRLNVSSIVKGLDDHYYFDIYQSLNKDKRIVSGYVKLEDIEFIDEKDP